MPVKQCDIINEINTQRINTQAAGYLPTHKASNDIQI
jgi:hypothetical protein